jgi:hypothetical protein
MPYKVIVEGATRGLMGDSGMETSGTILADKVNEAITDGGQPLVAESLIARTVKKTHFFFKL